MSHFSAVTQSLTDAWSRRGFIFIVYACLQLVAFALISPAMGALINFAVSLSDQSALTDQDIAMFLLSPVGFCAALAVGSVLLIAEVTGFIFMAAILKQHGSAWQAAQNALDLILSRLRALVVFAVLLVLRILVLALPFLLAGLAIAVWKLTDFDINYYLTFKPPEFKLAAGLIGALVLVLALVLLVRLSGWAVALHLVLFCGEPPKKAFALSAERMQGRRLSLQSEILIWLALRVLATVVVGLVVKGILSFAPLDADHGLRTALLLTAFVGLCWIVAGVFIGAIALGTLASLLGRYHKDADDAVQIPHRPIGGIGAAAGLAFVAIVGLGFWFGDRLMDDIQTKDTIEIIGHRGAAGARPENTMASVEKAIEYGADWVEIDVQETADDQIVVMHDSDFMKLAQVNLKTWDATMQDIAEIDIGSWFDPAYADQRAPLLRDVLLAAKGTDSKVLIELKYYGHDIDLENRVVAIVEDLGMTDRVATMSLKYPAVLKMQQIRPEWRAGVLAATSVGNLAGLQSDFVAINGSAVSAGMISAVNDAGKEVYVWTINDPLEMSRMVSLGVDGLITDEPALARRVLEVRAGLSTPERLALWLSQALGLKLDAKEYRDDSP